MIKFWRNGLAVGLVCVVGPSAAAATLTLGAVRDATMFENNVDNGSGGSNTLFSGTNGADNSPRRALIAFDVAGHLPAGSYVRSVDLTLVLGQFPNVGAVASSTIGLHRVLADWGEADTQLQTPPNDTFGGLGQGAPALEGDVTWNNRFHSATTPAPWTTPGGDYDPAVRASTVVTRDLNTGYTWTSTAGMVGDVQTWLNDPSSNFGWMLVNADETTPATFRGFYSRHVATSAFHPLLSINYLLAADFNGDDVVNHHDLDVWTSGVMAGGAADHSQGDANGDGRADGADFLVWQQQFGATAAGKAASHAVAEPATAALLPLAACLVAWARRRVRARPMLRMVLAPLFLIGAVNQAAQGATIMIGASQDSSIYFNHVDRGTGGGNALIAGTNGQDDPRRALIAFDVASAIPAGATVRSVELTLVLGQLPTSPMPSSTVNLHRLTSSWGEGTTQQQIPPNDSFGGMGQGAPASDGDVTWIARFWGPSPVLWNAPGGDFVSAASATAAIGTQIDVPYAWASTPGLVADVQGWLDDPASNFGWALVNADEQTTSTFRVFYSRQTATPELRPVLSVEYVAEPSSRLLVAITMVAPALGMLLRRNPYDSAFSAA